MKKLKPNSEPTSNKLKQGLPLWTILSVVVFLGFGAWNKFRTNSLKTGTSAPVAGTAHAPTSTGSAQANPSFAIGPSYQASAPPANKSVQNWQSGRYRVVDSHPSIVALMGADNARLSSLVSEVQLTRCTFNAQQVCVVMQGQQVLLTNELWMRLPERVLLNSPWQKPLLSPRGAKAVR